MDANAKIQAFYKACTDTKNAKFILAESKISEILRAIVNSPELVSVVSDSLAGFNFSSEFNKIQVKNEMRRINIILPKDQHKLIAIVFSLLGEIDAHRVDFHDFIFSYFDAGGSTLLQCYDKFVETIIMPFRDTLCEMVGYEIEQDDDDYYDAVDEDVDYIEDEQESEDEDTILPSNWQDDEESQEEDEMLDYNEYDDQEDDNYTDDQDDGYRNNRIDEFFDDVSVIINQIQDTINNDPRIKADRKDELNITLDAILLAIDYRSLKIFNALMISLNEMLKPVRSTKFYNNELQNRIAEFYDEML